MFVRIEVLVYIVGHVAHTDLDALLLNAVFLYSIWIV